MRVLSSIIGVLTLLAGMGMFLVGVTYPETFNLSSASAIQISQVYSEASFYLIQSIALLVFGAVFLITSAIGRHGARTAAHLQAVVNQLNDLPRQQRASNAPLLSDVQTVNR